MKSTKWNRVLSSLAGGMLAMAFALVPDVVFAAKTVSSDYTLSADEDWRADGVVTVEEGVNVDLNGHVLYLAGLAGEGSFTASENASFTDLSGSGTASSTVNGEVVQSAGTDKYPASNVFDDNNVTFFYYNGFSSQLEINYDFGSSTYVNCYKILGWSNTSYQNVPKAWVFQGSNDGTTWTDLDTQSDQSFVQNEEKTYVFYANNVSYSKYRIKITAVSNGSKLYVYEMQIGVVKNQIRIDPSQSAGFAAAENTIAGGIDCVLTGGTLPAEIDLRGIGRKITLEGALDLNGNALKVHALDGTGAITSTASVSDGTTPLTGSGTASACKDDGTDLTKTFHSSYPLVNAFDDTLSSYALIQDSDDYIVNLDYDFGTRIAVNRYAITIGTTDTLKKRAPRTWKIYASDDASIWMELHSVASSAVGAVDYVSVTNSFDNAVPYRYYRFAFIEAGNANVGKHGANKELAEIEYYYAGDGNYVRIEPAGLAESDLSNIDVSGDVELALEHQRIDVEIPGGGRGLALRHDRPCRARPLRRRAGGRRRHHQLRRIRPHGRRRFPRRLAHDILRKRLRDGGECVLECDQRRSARHG